MQDPNNVNDGGPAFPVPMVPHDSQGGFTEVRWQGMSVRTWLAGKAMGGILADGVSYDWDVVRMAKASVTLADALIAELEKGGADETNT